MAITQRGSVLVAADAVAGDRFGSAVAVSGDGLVLAVGASSRDTPGTNDGAVYVYDRAGSAWVQRGSVLLASPSNGNEYFGTSVALNSDGTVLAVGAPEWWHDPDEYYGAVFVYDWSGSAWNLRGIVDIDPADAVNFGAVMALSGNGLVLAVRNQTTGEFHIFDWSGSAWVQRGSSLPNGGYPGFGASIALSSDGSIAAIGATGYATPDTGAGAVVLFDYSGGTWTQRAALVQASDAAYGDNFGSSVALSSSGAVLAVGAPRWEGDTGTDYGTAYVFDWSGSVWTQRASVAAGDPANSDYFASSIALTGSADALIVGATNWEGAEIDQGGVYTFDVVNGDNVVAYTSLTLTASTGTAIAPTALTVEQKVSAATALTVSAPTGTVSAPTALAVTGTATLSAPTALALVDLATHWPLWSLRVVVDGVDVSARLRGQADVIAEEGAARLAHFAIVPASGVVAPLDWVGKPVYIDYLQTISGAEVARRVFTGRIDTPRYDPDATILEFDCVDDLQNRVAALDRAVIDALVGGRYTAAVQGDILDNWDYAQARLSTVAASLDAGAHGNLRVTDWELTSTWATLGAADLLYQRSSLAFPQRSTLVNSVTATLEYRYPRLRQRYASTGWSGTVIDMAPNGYQYPTQQDILGAAGGSGWTVTLGVFYPAPAAIPHSSGGFIYPPDDAIDMAILYLTQRHSQTVTETFTLTVTAPESVTANGTLPQAIRGALASEFDADAWESALDVAPLMPTGGDMDWAPDATRADADYAIQTLLDQARVKILGSHRSARVGNACLLNPDLDLDKKLAIVTAGMNVSGKVALVRHVFDLAAGSAVTEFEVACYGVGGAGIITPDSLDPPAPPAAAAETENWGANVPPLHVCTYGVTPYNDNLMGLLLNPPASISVDDVPGIGTKSYPNPFYVAGTYPVEGFRVQMPGVADADRNPLEKTVSASYQILIPTSDTLTFTVP